MPLKTTTILTTMLVALTLGGAPARADEQIKDSAQLKQIFAGNTAYITHRNGNKQQAYMRADGTAKITVKSGFKESKWEIDGDKICHDLSTQSKCYRVYKSSGDSYRLQSTDMQWEPVYAMKAGNTENY